MKTIATEVWKFKKGEVYGVDAIEDFPKHYYTEYFYDDDDSCLDTSSKHHLGEYELGSAKCKKSVEIRLTIKSN